METYIFTVVINPLPSKSKKGRKDLKWLIKRADILHIPFFDKPNQVDSLLGTVHLSKVTNKENERLESQCKKNKLNQ